jgi:hypothetical protein
MNKYAQDPEEHSIYTGTMPSATDQDEAQPAGNAPDATELTHERKKYHSSAMYAASKWHSPVGHVKAHSHRGLDL